MIWSEDRQRKFGWVFLIGLSVVYALANGLSAGGGPDVDGEPVLGLKILFWSLFALLFVPSYWILIFSTKRFGWSLREWGFGFSPRSWVVIGLATVLTAGAWLPASWYPESGTDVGQLRSSFGQVGWPLLVFLGYARVGEELMYRGFALVFLRRHLPDTKWRTVIAIVLSSALFCFMHTHRGPGEMVALFFTGALPLAAVTVWGRSLSLALVVHGLAGAGHVGALFGLVFFFVLAVVGRTGAGAD